MRLVEDLDAVALPTGLVEQELERDPPRGAGGQVDRALLLDGALRGLVVEARVEVVDHPQLLQVAARTIDELHVVGDAVAHLAREWAGDVDEHVVLGPHGPRAEHRRQHHETESAVPHVRNPHGNQAPSSAFGSPSGGKATTGKPPA
jgi:hypothetical protein